MLYSQLMLNLKGKVKPIGGRLGTLKGIHVRHFSWLSLESFVNKSTDSRNQLSWKHLKNLFVKAQHLINSYYSPFSEGRPQNRVVWKRAQMPPYHQVSKNMKSVHDHYMKFYDKTIAEEMRILVSPIDSRLKSDSSWKLYEQSVTECADAIVGSQQIIDDISRSLWVSQRNPDMTDIPPGDWLKSDLYWQAYLEHHYYYDPSKDVKDLSHETYEDGFDTYMKQWHTQLHRFHDRSANPILYSMVDQTHSSDYYDLHRWIFLQHIIYFLLHTGKSYVFFQEIPPRRWIAEIENLKYFFLQRHHNRIIDISMRDASAPAMTSIWASITQVDDSFKKDQISRCLELNKIICTHVVSHLMANFMFLCYPAIPCQSAVELKDAIDQDNGKGEIFTLGPNVDALFYIEVNDKKPFSHAKAPESPVKIVKAWLEKLDEQNSHLSPDLLDICYIIANILEMRGKAWFSAPGEHITESFIRRFTQDDEFRPIFEDYIDQLKSLWLEQATCIPVEEAWQKIIDIEKKYLATEKDSLDILQENISKIYSKVAFSER